MSPILFIINTKKKTKKEIYKFYEDKNIPLFLMLL